MEDNGNGEGKDKLLDMTKTRAVKLTKTRAVKRRLDRTARLKRTANGESGQIEKVLGVTEPLKIRDIGSDMPIVEQNGMEARVKAANALGDVIREHGLTVVPVKWSVYNITMLHTLVSMGMRHAAAQNEESLVRVAGEYRQAVSELWLKLGMTIEDCQVLNNDIIVMAPKKPEPKKD